MDETTKLLKEVEQAVEEAGRVKKTYESLIAHLGPAIIEALKPMIASLGPKMMETLRPLMKIEVAPSRVDVRIPEIKVPEARVHVTMDKLEMPHINIPAPIVNIPEYKQIAPIVNIPETRFPDSMDVRMPTITQKAPLPVQVINQPAQTKIMSVSDIQTSIAAAIVDATGIAYSGSNPLPVVITSGAANTSATNIVDSSGVAYSGSNPLPTTGTATLSAAVGQGDTATALRVVHAGDSATSVATQTQGLNETNAGTLRVVAMTDSVTSVNVVSSVALVVTSVTNSIAAALVDSSGVAYSGSNPLPTTGSATLSAAVGQGDTATALRIVHAGDSATSVATQTQGLNESNAGTLRVIQMTDTVTSANIVTFNGTAPAVGTNETTSGVLRIIQMSDTVSSSNVTAFNGNAPAVGQNETTSGVLRVVQMSDTMTSTNVVQIGGVAIKVSQGDGANATGSQNILPMAFNGTTHDRLYNNPGLSTFALRVVHAVDVGTSAKGIGLSMTTLPTAVGDAAETFTKTDKLGRQVMRSIQVRDLVSTAYVSLTTGTEATLATAAAGQFLDLIYIMAANTSNAAVQIDVRAVSAGNIVQTLEVPANATQGFALPVPWPQDATGNSWTVDMPDITGTTVGISALFSKES